MTSVHGPSPSVPVFINLKIQATHPPSVREQTPKYPTGRRTPNLAAVPEPGPLSQRDCHLEMITEQGRPAWQAATDSGRRSSVETTMRRYKALMGPRLRARGFAAQQTEAAIGVTVLNRMLLTGRPTSVRCQQVVA